MSLSWPELVVRFREEPLLMAKALWPHVDFYDKQREMTHSVRDDDETVVYAANEMGKDFDAAFIVLWFFLTRTPCRIVTTSAKDHHLRVLWGEINRFIQTSKVPLDYRKGGPLIVNHQDIRRIIGGEKCPISYVLGMVASPDTLAAMQGHHATPTDPVAARDGVPRTLFVADESSSVPHGYYEMAVTWSKRRLLFGNCWPCDNFFKHAVKGRPGTKDRGGDIPRPSGKGHYRRVIRIRAQDSPNVRWGLLEEARGLEPTNRILVPGVKTYSAYKKDRATLDPHQQAVILDASFYEGPELMLFPSAWLDLAEERADELVGIKRRARAIGIDTGEGAANTVWTAGDELGVIEQVSMKTPDTSIIPGYTIEFGEKWDVPAEKWVFDRGGGGKEHADTLRSMGYEVDAIGFGETMLLPPQHGTRQPEERHEVMEQRTAFKNRRAQMYGTLSQILNPKGNFQHPEYGLIRGYAIPREYVELRRQLGPIPKQYTEEGTLKLPPKNRRTENSKEKTLVELLGCSPDEADSTVLMVYGVFLQPEQVEAGAF